MGNSASSSDNDDEAFVENKDDDHGSDEEQEADGEPPQILDLSILFNTEALRAAASKVKEEMPENIIQQHSSQLIRWLQDRINRYEETVTLAQFCDFLINRSVDRQDSVQTFQQFDAEGDGTADAHTMMDTIKALTTGEMQGELGYVIRMLQACLHIPGFIDVYTENKLNNGKHGSRLLNFLLRHRAPSPVLPLALMDSFNRMQEMRSITLGHYLQKMKDAASRQQEEECMLSEGEELKLITKCYSCIEVSTNRSDVYRLSNGDPNSYWQSDGSARSHWVRLKMKSNVVLKSLSVAVANSDQSYMPQLIGVSVGKSPHNLREIKEVRVASHINGDVILLENAKVYYPYVQINIKRCQSDGCDTRLHGVKTIGYRILRDQGISVVDASAVWYLQVLASTATAAMPTTPALRDAILQHTKDALKHMPPLSLSTSSPDKPSILSTHVLKQVHAFLADLAIDEKGKLSANSFQALLSFNLARGHVYGTLKTLQTLQEHSLPELDCSHMLQQLESVKESYWRKYGSSLSLSLAGCDGGQKEDSCGPATVLSSSWSSSQAYLSGDGKTKMNMIFKGADCIQVTRVKIKVDKGPRGAKRGMIFVYQDKEPFDLDKHVAKFSGYDTWTSNEYSLCQKLRSAKKGGKPDNPVAYFTIEDEWDEVEICLDVCPVGDYILVKFLEARQSSAERLGIIGIRFFGYHRKGVFVEDQEQLQPVPEAGKLVPSQVVFTRTLSFLADLARDQPSSRGPMTSKPQSLDMSDTSLDLLWELYQGFQEEDCKKASLQLMHTMFPYFAEQKKDQQESVNKLFEHLCELVDSEKAESGHPPNQQLVRTAVQLIKDGAAVFFPDKEARRKHLFNMVTSMNGQSDLPSVTLTFQSLCQFFGSMGGLLDLPSTLTKDFEPDPIMKVMETLICVASQDMQASGSQPSQEQSQHLMQLLCSLQTSLLAWCHRHLQLGPDKELATLVQALVLRYVSLVTDKAVKVLAEILPGKELSDTEALKKCIQKQENMFLGSAVRQLLALLACLADLLTSTTRMQLLHILQPLVTQLNKAAGVLPQLFPKVEDNAWQAGDKEVLFKSWEVESPHNYENNQHATQVFSCPGASSFEVEFDPRCETEKRYDYLEFTDSRGVKTRFDQKVGTEKWQPVVTFTGGHQLRFLFHSDSSNTEWGYKFKVKAKGMPWISMEWIYDLQLSLGKTLGKISGATLHGQTGSAKLKELGEAEDPETELLKSELWTTLFRGGYMVGKLQRSLSGKHVAVEDSSASGFLSSMIEGEEGAATRLLQRCREQSVGPKVGGQDVEKAVVAVFAALIWHTQALREDIARYEKSEGEGKISEGLQQAYNTAEAFRMQLVDHRQKQKVAAEKEGSDSKEPDLVDLCLNKALFLLKFAGLAKVHLRQESKNHKVNKNPGLGRGLSRSFSLTGQKTVKIDSGLEKYPSFRLVLTFINDPAWSKDRVQDLLQERSKQAQAISKVLMFAAEYVRLCGQPHVFQVPVLVFLRELLTYQERFSKHYLDGLDGCGLEAESGVREAYYTLVRRLLDSLKAVKRHTLSRSLTHAYDFVQACTLHFLDVAWQPYDLSFLVNIKLPEMLMDLSIRTVSMREKSVSEDSEAKELEMYKKTCKWLKECQHGQESFISWYDSAQALPKDEKRDVQMFVARYCDILDVEINCDGCGITLPGGRYRCLQCADMDLCATCFAGGVKPGGGHSDDHEMFHLQFKCDECQGFIVGTRIHCTVCEDFDLCLGCHSEGKFPPGHSADHPTSKLPMVKLKVNETSSSSLQAYIHQHVWLLFTTLALNMADVMHRHGNGNGVDNDGTDMDYIKAATQLHSSCVELITGCLMKVSEMPEPEEEVNDDEASLYLRQEVAFAVHAQERILGLLGAMMPPDGKTLPELDETSHHSYTSEKFLVLLFKIATGESNHEQKTQHMAMGLIGQLLQKTLISCEIIDKAVTESSGKELLADAPPGKTTAKFLFDFGASCLERNGMNWAHSMSVILQKLFNTALWRDIFSSHVTDSIQQLIHKPELSSIFALFVMSGFPEVFSFGCHVTYSDLGTETKSGVVMKHFPDRMQSMVVDCKSRKRRLIKDEYLENIKEEVNILSLDNIKTFTQLVKEIGAKVKPGEALSVEKVWVLALSLKTLFKAMRCNPEGERQEMFNPEFIQAVVQLAGLGTKFSREWLLKDLEVMSLMLYTKHSSAESEKETGDKSEDASMSKEGDESKEEGKVQVVGSPAAESQPQDGTSSSGSSETTTTTAASDTNSSETDPMEGLDKTAKLCFEVLQEHMDLPLHVLRALYDMSGSDTSVLLTTIQENLQENSTLSTTDLKELAKMWETPKVTTPKAEQMAEKAMDIGIEFSQVENEQKDTAKSEPEIEAVDEPTLDTQKLIEPPEVDMKHDKLKKRKSQSAALFKKEMEAQGRMGSREFLIKVNRAVAILYARRVLLALLDSWPVNSPPITAELIGCKDSSQVPFVLDLLNRTEQVDSFQEIVQNIIRHCEPKCLSPIAVTACQFMKEVGLSCVIKESEHNYKNDTSESDKIRIPGASFLSIRFDNRCATEEGCDELVLSTSADHKENRHVFSGTRNRWQDIDLPGDTLYYKFVSDCSNNMWGYKFTVTGGKIGRFDTGLLILKAVLSLPNVIEMLPLGDLWRQLVVVACKRTGRERLGALHLLLRIMQAQTRSETCESLLIDLPLLRPLWKLYNKLSAENVEAGTVVPPVVRALTEFFLVAEDLAADWGIEREYVASLHDDMYFHKIIFEGIRRVAAASLSIGYENKATRLLREAKLVKDS